GHRVAVCENSASEAEPTAPEFDHGRISLSPEPLPPEIPAFDRTGDNAPKLTDKYRPRTLAEVLGQPEIVASLQRFVAAPYSCAMLFTGDSGIGKTSAAYALAHDLGCAVEEGELGGVFEIPSGSQTAESVRKILDLLRYRPLCGSGWRVLMVNECDRMALPVETIWLDALEHLPAQTVVVFTTNEPARLSQRFRNRCEEYAFLGGSDRLKPWIDALARRLWEREGDGEMPDLDGMGMPTLGDTGSMTASFRLALQQLQTLLRSA
ncbi:MAG TPA: AAA family ATPase, partial [Gemmataceae bacterium]|nr:AAA family ATPase [Gemmataceae bacterium]